MSHYISYNLPQGGLVYIEVIEDNDTPIKAARGEDVVEKATQSFTDAFTNIRQSILTLRDQMNDLDMDEVQVSFDLKVSGELGFVIGKLGAEFTFRVALSWKRK